MAVRQELREAARDQPDVRVPTAADDRPAWGRIAVLAAVGFAVGIAWPRLAGVRLGPSAPSESLPAAASAAPDHAPNGAGGASSAAVPATLLAPSSSAGSPSPSASAAPIEGVGKGAPAVSVASGKVLSCHTADGELHKGTASCGDLSALDAILQPKVRRLSSCPASDAQVGKLAVLFSIDFNAGTATSTFGKSSTLQNLDSLSACLRPQLTSISLAGIAHDQPRYTVLYNTTFANKDATAGKEVPVAAAGGEEPAAQVVWDVAIVRDTPKTGTVVARLQRGTKLHVSSGQDGWYRVKYGSGFTSEGWVYRGAIGK